MKRRASNVTARLGGRQTWGGKKDDDGHREFRVEHHVFTDDSEDGPYTAMTCPGLPLPGAMWNFGNDIDVWAFCYPSMECDVFQEEAGSPNKDWLIKQKFSTKPLRRCQDTQIEDPLLEPQGISGGFVKFTKEATRDRFGRLIKSSSHEIIRGPGVEFEKNRPTVTIEQNVLFLGLEDFSRQIDHVNDSLLWGCPPRCVKLSDVSWKRKLFGICNYYYTRVFTFDVDFDTFDRNVPDEGTKVLNGHWRFSKIGTASGGFYLKIYVPLFDSNGLPIGKQSFNTSPLSNSATASDVANEILSLIGSGNCTANGGPLPQPIDVEFLGDYALMNLDPMTAGSSLYEVKTIQNGNSISNDIQRIQEFGPNSWIVDKVGGKMPDWKNPAHFIRFKDRNGENSRTLLDGRGLPAEKTDSYSEDNINTVQELILYGAPDAGTFTLSLDGETTADISFNDTNTAIKNAIEGLTNVDIVDVTLGPLPNTSVKIEFQGTHAGQNVPLMTVDTTNLTGPNSVLGEVTYAAGVQAAKIHVEYYPETNFLELGIPVEIGN